MDTGGLAWQDDGRKKRLFPFFFNPTAEANLRRSAQPPSRGRRESARGLPFLTHRLRGVPCRRKDGESPFPIAKPFPRIVISSESEKSFSFAVRKSCEECGERETPYFMRFGSTVFHADGFTKENGNGKRKRSLGCARDDKTGEVHLTLFFNPTAEANLRPFGAPPSGGRRESARNRAAISCTSPFSCIV